MNDKQNIGGRDRLVRLVLTVVLSVLSVRWLRKGKRLRGLLAGVGAVGLGFNATTGYCGVNDALDVDTATDEVAIGFEEETTGEGSASTTGDSESAEDSESTAKSPKGGAAMTCAACGEPIVPGQNRGPNGDDEIVHDACA